MPILVAGRDFGLVVDAPPVLAAAPKRPAAMLKSSRLSLRPAGSPEAPLSARARRRLPQAPASLGPSAARAALAGLLQAVFSTPLPLPLTLPLPPPLPLLLRPTTDAEFSLSTERQLDPDEEDGRLVTARDDGTETMQRNWPKPFGNW